MREIGRTLITGCSGALGSRIVKELDLRGLPSLGFTFRNQCKQQSLLHKCLNLDLLSNPEVVENYVNGTTTFIHTAWVTDPKSYKESIENSQWEEASLKMIGVLKKYDQIRIIGVGTCSEYLWQGDETISEKSQISCESLYAQKKFAIFQYLQENHKNFVWCRIFFQYGDSNRKGTLYGDLIEHIKTGKKMIVKRPDDIIDYIHVSDVAKIMTKFVENKFVGSVNIGTGKGVTTRDFVTNVSQNFKATQILHFEKQLEPTLHVVSDGNLLKSLIGQYDFQSI